MARFHQWLGPQIDIADMGEYANGGDDGCTDQTEDHNLQMRPRVGAINGMSHGNPPNIN